MQRVFKFLFRKLKILDEFYEAGVFNRRLFNTYLFSKLVNLFFGLNPKSKYIINHSSIITASEKINIGKNVWKSLVLSPGCYFQGGNGIDILDDVIIAPGVSIISSNHDRKDLSKHIKVDKIIIGEAVWIGANATILPGVKIGSNSIVGAGAVVTKSFPPNSIIVGNPAKAL